MIKRKNSRRKRSSKKGMAEDVWPIKKLSDVRAIENALLNHFRAGRRNYTIFQVGKATLLRCSDVLALRWSTVFDSKGHVRENAFIKDQKTGKPNTLYLTPVRKDLEKYRDYRIKHGIKSPWLFPSSRHPENHIARKQYYRIMKETGAWLGIKHLGTHSMRKTGAYEVYKQTGNIALVQHLLNHSSEKITLRYLGLNNPSVVHALNHVTFY